MPSLPSDWLMADLQWNPHLDIPQVKVIGKNAKQLAFETFEKLLLDVAYNKLKRLLLAKSDYFTTRVSEKVNSWSCLIDCSFKIFYLINRLPILPKQWNQYFQFVPPLAVCLQTDTKHLRTTIKFEVQYWLQKTRRNSMLSFFYYL